MELGHKKTLIEVYLAFESIDFENDFSIAYVTDKLGVFPTYTQTMGKWIEPDPVPRNYKAKQYNFTEWQYSTGKIETVDFPMLVDKIVQTFKDKVHIINELKNELSLKPIFCSVTHIIDGSTPAYSLSIEQMQFAIDIGAKFSIDEYVSDRI